jgi:hypothetical protein
MRSTFYIALLSACGTNLTPQPAPSPELPSCIPDRDGQITADELPIALGEAAPYYAGTMRTISQVPQAGLWDFSDERSDDEVVAIGPAPLRDQWYAPSFPAGQFVVDAGSGLDGIYHQDAQALWLAGTASRTETNKTLIVYPQPLAVLRFPVTVGDMFTQTVALTNVTINGLPFNGSDELTVEVVESGELSLPYVEFSPTLRVRTSAVRRPSSGGMTGRRQSLWLFECFGEIARAESRADETNADFTMAAYFRRFALGVTP